MSASAVGFTPRAAARGMLSTLASTDWPAAAKPVSSQGIGAATWAREQFVIRRAGSTV